MLQQQQHVHEEHSTTPLLLPPPLAEKQRKRVFTSDTPGASETETEIRTLDTLEKQAIADALEACDGNKRRTAKVLGINERTLYRKIRKYGLGGEN